MSFVIGWLKNMAAAIKTKKATQEEERLSRSNHHNLGTYLQSVFGSRPMKANPIGVPQELKMPVSNPN